MTPNSNSSRTGAMIANSTIDCDCWPVHASEEHLCTSVAAHDHVRVGNDVNRAAQQALEEPRHETKAHDENYIYVRALVAAVGRGRRQIQPWRVGVADVEDRGVQIRWIHRILVWRVVRGVAVGGIRTCGAACIPQH